MFVVGIEIDGIAFLEFDFIVVNIDFEPALQKEIEFLTGVGVSLWSIALRPRIDADQKRFGFFMNKIGREILVAVLFVKLHRDPFVFAGLR